MEGKLISFSLIKVPLQPYCDNYIIGIVENSNFERIMVQIKDISPEELTIGLEGIITQQSSLNSHIINVFTSKEMNNNPESWNN